MIPASKSSWMIYFYPRPPRGGRQGNFRDLTDILTISIHALREEGDTKAWTISPGTRKFLSTPSARRATTARRSNKPDHNNFYPRPPRGGRRCEICQRSLKHGISIHALREEGDGEGAQVVRYHIDFYPRPPRGGRPRSSAASAYSMIFLSTPSARRATTSDTFWRATNGFLSTPSARRATQGIRGSCVNFIISIHALREEGDSKNRDKISIFKQIIQHSARI
mgnify:CR=1 FL=1